MLTDRRLSDGSTFASAGEAALRPVHAGHERRRQILIGSSAKLPPSMAEWCRDHLHGAALYAIDPAPAAASRSSVEGIAAELASTLILGGGGRPWRLAGWGAQGLIAYETALQLIGRGEAVAELALLDGGPAPAGGAAARAYRPQIFPLRLRCFSWRSGGGWREHGPAGGAEGSPTADLAEQVAASGAASRSRGARLRVGSLIELQTASSAPLFCIPGAGASSLCFLGLAAALGPGQSIYGMEPRGLDGAEVPHASVEAAAGAYLSELLAAAPVGPFHLLGHSWGGVVALELAVRLERIGRAPASLAVIDAPPIRSGGPSDPSEEEILEKLLRVYGQRAGRALPLTARSLAKLGGVEQRTALRDAMVSAGLFPKAAREDVLRGPLSVFARAARTDYRPAARFGGTLGFAMAADSGPGSAEDVRLRRERIASWSRAAAQATFRDIPGDHMSMLAGPNARALAKWWLQHSRDAGGERR